MALAGWGFAIALATLAMLFLRFPTRVDLQGLVDDWLGVVEETMEPSAAGVWIKEHKG